MEYNDFDWLADFPSFGDALRVMAMTDDNFSPLDLDMPLNATKPPLWAIKERRVEWVLHNFTEGELAYVYKVLHDGRGMRRSGVDEVMKKEKTT